MSAHRPHRQAVKRAVIAYAERLNDDGYSHDRCMSAAIDAAYPALVAERDALRAQVARVEDAKREHREEWASYFESRSGAVGPEPLTVELVVKALRWETVPFGCSASDDA